MCVFVFLFSELRFTVPTNNFLPFFFLKFKCSLARVHPSCLLFLKLMFHIPIFYIFLHVFFLIFIWARVCMFFFFFLGHIYFLFFMILRFQIPVQFFNLIFLKKFLYIFLNSLPIYTSK